MQFLDNSPQIILPDGTLSPSAYGLTGVYLKSHGLPNLSGFTTWRELMIATNPWISAVRQRTFKTAIGGPDIKLANGTTSRWENPPMPEFVAFKDNPQLVTWLADAGFIDDVLLPKGTNPYVTAVILMGGLPEPHIAKVGCYLNQHIEHRLRPGHIFNVIGPRKLDPARDIPEALRVQRMWAPAGARRGWIEPSTFFVGQSPTEEIVHRAVWDYFELPSDLPEVEYVPSDMVELVKRLGPGGHTIVVVSTQPFQYHRYTVRKQLEKAVVKIREADPTFNAFFSIQLLLPASPVPIHMPGSSGVDGFALYVRAHTKHLLGI